MASASVLPGNSSENLHSIRPALNDISLPSGRSQSLTTENSISSPPAADAANSAQSATAALPPPHKQSLAFDDIELLQKMEIQNRRIEQDTKSVSGTGSRKSADSDSDGSPLNQSGLAEDLQEDLWTVWSDLIKGWESEYKRRASYIRELVRRGIPCHFRTLAWQLLSNANPQSVHDMYAEYMRSVSPHEKVIKRDVSRTYPEHDFFKDPNGRGQQSLLNVMKAYSLHDREVGYCQGSAFIAGLLLLQMPEEEAFAVILRLMEDYRLRELYKPAMTELGLCMFQLENIVQDQMPDLYMHFQNMGFDTSMYASSWFLTLFTTQLPLELSCRVMDVFISEGMEMVFRLAMAILQLCRVDLLQLDMEGMLRYFQRDVGPRLDQDHDLLLTTAYNATYNAKRMKKYEKDYLTKRTKEQEEAVELRRLRTENRLLRQRIEYLEQESAALADRLIQGQVDLAENAEACLNIKHELHTLREVNNSAHRRLEEAYETIRDLTSGKANYTVCEVGVQVDDKEMIERIHILQQELMETKSREADHENTIRDLRHRVQDIENANRRLRETPPDHCIASLQEELISVKMREAEATLSLKEMRQKIVELDAMWQKFISGHSASPEESQDRQQSAGVMSNTSVTSPTSSVSSGHFNPQTSSSDGAAGPNTQQPKKSAVSNLLSSAGGLINSVRGGDGGGVGSSGSTTAASVRELEEQLMGVRIHEAETLAELKEMKQKVMELETQNHVCTNQIRRQDDEYKKLLAEYEKLQRKEMELQSRLRDLECKSINAESQMKEHSVMGRLKETELLQTITELKNRVAELESRSAERWTQDQLNNSGMESMTDPEPETPTSLTNSFNGGDGLSLCSEISASDYTITDQSHFFPKTSTTIPPISVPSTTTPGSPLLMNGGSSWTDSSTGRSARTDSSSPPGITARRISAHLLTASSVNESGYETGTS